MVCGGACNAPPHVFILYTKVQARRGKLPQPQLIALFGET